MVCKIPNALTIFRILLAFVLLEILIAFPGRSGDWGVAIFLIAMVTDFFDGYLARKFDCITLFGKVMDPLADKLAVFAALLGLVYWQMASLWAVFLILSREFLVSGIRIIAAKEGADVSASMMGKAKTVLQAVAVVALLLQLPYADVLLWTATLVTLWTGYDYCRAYFFQPKKV